MFADETTVSKGMVKYASQITRESIADIGGVLSIPESPVEGCSQTQVRSQHGGESLTREQGKGESACSVLNELAGGTTSMHDI